MEEDTSMNKIAAQTEAAVQDAAANADEAANVISVEPKAGEDDVAAGTSPVVMYGAIGIAVVVAIAIMAMALRRRCPAGGGPKSGGTGAESDVVEIYVGNISYDMNDAQLRKEFERYGVVKSARVITHRANGKSKGYGFVEMPHRKEAIIAIKALDTSEVMGRRLRVNEARANTRPPEK